MCDSPEGTYMMCPLCDESLGCHPVDLHGSCMLGKVCTLNVKQSIFARSFTGCPASLYEILMKCSRM